MSDLNKTTYLPSEMAEEIRGLKQYLGSSSTHSDTDDVLFYDYDGTVLHSFSAFNFLCLEQMPENPVHEGLTSQGWNWSLDEAKEYVTKHRQLDIGQMYITDDGKTRLYLDIDSDNFDFYIDFLVPANKRVVINWGDRNEETFSYGDNNFRFHTYAHSGEYIVTVANDDSEPSSYSIRFPIGNIFSTYAKYITAPIAIRKIEIGERAHLSSPAYTPDVYSSYLHNLETITIPRWLEDRSSSDGGFLCDAYCLKHVTIPAGFDIIPQAAVDRCYSLQSISIPNNVTNIVSSAFVSCHSLKRIILPDTVDDIWNGAMRQTVFGNCFSLRSFTFPDNYIGQELTNHEFFNCSSLSKIVIPNSIERIGEYAFSTCTALKTITLPVSLDRIGRFAFQNCQALQDIAIPNGITTLEENVFDNCSCLSNVTLPLTLTKIRDYAFQNCKSLARLDLPEALSEIGEGAFEMSGLEEIHIPESVTAIKKETFFICSVLSRVSLSSQTTSIGASAFGRCYALDTIGIPETLEELGEAAFAGSGLKEIYIPGSVECIPKNCFSSCFRLKRARLGTGVKELAGYAFQDCKALKYVELPDTIIKCEYNTFQNCTSLTSIVLPKRLNRIGTMMFDGCTNLKNVVLPKSLDRISDYAFQNCTSLETIEFPKRLEGIYSFAFSNCTALKEIRFHSIEPPWIDNSWEPGNVFKNLPMSCVIYVPRGTLNSYITAEGYPSSVIYEYVEYDDEYEEPDLDASISNNYLYVDGSGVDVNSNNLVFDSDFASVNDEMLKIDY